MDGLNTLVVGACYRPLARVHASRDQGGVAKQAPPGIWRDQEQAERRWVDRIAAAPYDFPAEKSPVYELYLDQRTTWFAQKLGPHPGDPCNFCALAGRRRYANHGWHR